MIDNFTSIVSTFCTFDELFNFLLNELDQGLLLMKLKNEFEKVNLDSKEFDYNGLRLLVFILPISIFTPGFILTTVCAYFIYFNSLQIWLLSICLSLLFGLIIWSITKDWTKTIIRYLLCSGISTFILLLIFLFGLRSNFVIGQVYRLFKNDSGLELIAHIKTPIKYNLDLYCPNIQEFEKLPPSEKKVWMNGMQGYVSSKYNREGELELFENLKYFFNQRDFEFRMAENSILNKRDNNLELTAFYSKRNNILSYREFMLRKANKYFANKTTFTNYQELYQFFSCFP